jgi:hypothetical protein
VTFEYGPRRGLAAPAEPASGRDGHRSTQVALDDRSDPALFVESLGFVGEPGRESRLNPGAALEGARRTPGLSSWRLRPSTIEMIQLHSRKLSDGAGQGGNIVIAVALAEQPVLEGSGERPYW